MPEILEQLSRKQREEKRGNRVRTLIIHGMEYYWVTRGHNFEDNKLSERTPDSTMLICKHLSPTALLLPRMFAIGERLIHLFFLISHKRKFMKSHIIGVRLNVISLIL